MTGRLAGKVALITGTAKGQGRAAAVLFAAEGATVVGSDRDAADAEETVCLVREAGGRMTSTHPLDFTDEAAAKAWVDVAAAAHGRIDILYNDAGATRFGPIDQTSAEDWSFTLRHELDIVSFATKHPWPTSSPAAAACCWSARPPVSRGRSPTPVSPTPPRRAASSR